MNLEEAREVMKKAEGNVDYINLGRTITALASGEMWKTFDNSKWRPNKPQARYDAEWLSENILQIFEAMTVFYEERNATKTV